MNRSFIFGAWDKIKNQMILVNIIDFRDNSIASVETIDGYKIEGDLNFVLMQFTGLTDKNGVKIFEGDKTPFGTVEFSNGCWNINGDRLLSWFKEIEVIGNIFENKELLK